ncbi:MAG: class I SAM-dependent methyltransferase [Actinomycetes bacterium]
MSSVTQESSSGRRVSCVVCGSDQTRLARDNLQDFEYSVVPEEPLTAWECSSCRSQFLEPRPSEGVLSTFYPEDYHCYNEDHGGFAKQLVAARARRRSKQYRNFLGGNSGRLFDVGAGDCRHFDELRGSLDLECAGVELNPQMAEAGRARGYDIHDGTLEELDITEMVGTFDIVSMNHVLEHVINPIEVVRRCYLLLRPGGYIVGQLPCFSSWEARAFGRAWGGYHFPRHLQMFSAEGLRQLLSSCGLSEPSARSALHVQTALSLQNATIRAGWHPKMRYGKSPAYGAFLLAAVPFEIAAFACNRGGIMNFSARRPIASGPEATPR